MTDVHTSHCCIVHGCKYMDDDCTVLTYAAEQEYLCEWCSDTAEDFYVLVDEWNEMQKRLPARLLPKLDRKRS